MGQFILALMQNFLFSLALALELSYLSQMDKLIIDLLLIMLQLVPIVFIMISKLLAEEKFNRRIFVNLMWTFPSSIQVATRPRRLFVPKKIVLLRAV